MQSSLQLYYCFLKLSQAEMLFEKFYTEKQDKYKGVKLLSAQADNGQQTYAISIDVYYRQQTI